MANQTEKRDILIRLDNGKALSSLKELEGASKSLRNEWKLASNDADRSKIAAQLKNVNTEIGKQTALTKGASKGWKELVGSMVSMGAAMGAMFAIQAIGTAFAGMVQSSAQLSDQLSDVQKTTGLTAVEVDHLAKSLKGLDTRSSRKELLGLAYEAGKLGITGVAAVQKFVSEADKITVALGEDLGDGAVLKIGKMASAFKTGMLNIASAVNSVGQSSMASEGYLVEFASRMQGTAVTAAITAPDIIGYGAALDSLGLPAEMASTALNTFFIDFVKNTEMFGEMAGFAAGELTALVGSEGSNAGFMAFLAKLKELNPEADQFLARLEDMGIDGARGAQTFLALSNNLGMVADMQDKASKSFAEGTSVIDEFNIKNDNFAADLAIVSKSMSAWFSSTTVVDWIVGITGALRNYLSVSTPISANMKNEQLQLATIGVRLMNVNTKQEDRIKLIKELQTAYPSFLKNMDAESVTNEQLAKALKETNQQLINKIVIQQQQEKIEAKAAEAARIVLTQADAELELAKLMATHQKEAIGYTQDDTKTLLENAAAMRDVLLATKEHGTERGKTSKWTAILAQMNLQMGTLSQAQLNYNSVIFDSNELLLEQQHIKKMLGIVDEPVTPPDDPSLVLGGASTTDETDAQKKAREKAIQDEIDNTLKLQQQLQKIKIDAIDNVEQREIAALRDAYVRDAQEIESTIANEALKADLQAALAEELQRKIGIIETEAAALRVTEFEKKVQAEIDAANNSDLLTLELKVAVATADSTEMLGALINQLAKQMEIELQNLNLTEEQKLLIKQDYALRAEALFDEQAAKQKEKSLALSAQQQQDAQDALTIIGSAYNALFTMVSQGYALQIRESEIAQNSQIADLQKQLDAGIISQVKFDEEKLKLETKFSEEQRKLKREQWEVDQMARITEAVMGIASAVIVAMGGGPFVGQVLAGITAALGAVQLGYIAAETNPYYAGGRTKVKDTEGNRYTANNVGTFANGGRYSTPSYGIVGERGSELVIPNWLFTSPDYSDTMYQLESAIARGYAKGGVTSSSQSIVATPSAPQQGYTELAMQVLALTEEVRLLRSNGVKGYWEWDKFTDGVLTQETIENKKYFRGSDNRRAGQRV